MFYTKFRADPLSPNVAIQLPLEVPHLLFLSICAHSPGHFTLEDAHC